MNLYRDWQTLREIDEQRALPKGTAFRHFKSLEPGLVETQDYLVLHHEQHRQTIEQLRSARRIYDSSINVLLLSPQVAARLSSIDS